MKDGRTVKRSGTAHSADLAGFLDRFEATLVVVRGKGAGKEHALDRPKLVLGRGPGVDVVFDDAEMSRQHVAVEFTGGGFRLCDLGSTNGTLVNGTLVRARELAHGDRIEIGQHVVQLRLEQHEVEPQVYSVPDA
jgi:pSer/pThr/pTyr-binding forkhead associated (FHA) protein